MFSSVKDHNKTFQTLRQVLIITLIGAFLLNGLLVYYILTQSETQAKRVYVVTDRGTFSALYEPERKVSPFEARNHVKTFLSTMFAHDATNYKERVEAALHLISKTDGQRIISDFTKGKVYENYVRLGSKTYLQVDSVVIDGTKRPLTGKAYARQTIHLSGQSQDFPIAIQFELAETYRSDENPYGILLQNMNYIHYNPQHSATSSEER